MASSLALKKLLAPNLLARSVKSFRPGASTTRLISTNPFRDNDPQDDHHRPSNLAFHVVVPLSPTASLIRQLLLFLYGGGPALVHEWAKVKKTTKPIRLSIPLDEEEEEEEEVKVILGIKDKSGLLSAPRSVWLNETAKGIQMLKEGRKVGKKGVLVLLSHEIGCEPLDVWGKYTNDGLHLHVAMPGVGIDEVKVSVEENTVDIEGEPPIEIVYFNIKYTMRIDLPEKIFKTLDVEAKIKDGMLEIYVPKVNNYDL